MDNGDAHIDGTTRGFAFLVLISIIRQDSCRTYEGQQDSADINERRTVVEYKPTRSIPSRHVRPFAEESSHTRRRTEIRRNSSVNLRRLSSSLQDTPDAIILRQIHRDLSLSVDSHNISSSREDQFDQSEIFAFRGFVEECSSGVGFLSGEVDDAGARSKDEVIECLGFGV